MTPRNRLFSASLVFFIGGALLMLPLNINSTPFNPQHKMEPMATIKGWAQTANVQPQAHSAADTSAYDYGDPTAAEQAHLEAINRARGNPVGEAARYGIALQEGVPPGAISDNPSQPLTSNAKLLAAARKHSVWMLENDLFVHVTPQGISPADRIEAETYSWMRIGENIAFRGSTGPLAENEQVLQMHGGLFVDEGIEGRGHRVNILNDDFREAGVGVAFGEFKGFANSYMLTADFGTASDRSNAFVLGVVYDDQNADGTYTSGEGLADVTIRIEGAGLQTTTASAGGYGIPVAAGNYTVEAQLGDGRTASENVSIDAKNIKVDFMVSDFTGSVNVDPRPSILANGSDGALSVTAQQPVAIAIGMVSGTRAFARGDYWILHALNQVQYFDAAALDFVPGFRPTLQAPLVAFDPLVIFSRTLPAGKHVFCLAFDGVANGTLESDQLFFDCVTVDVAGP